jgi:mRNA interferase YafQ
MLAPPFTRQFRKDVERARRRGKDLEKLKAIVRSLIAGRPLDTLHRDHGLAGAYSGRRECHIEADWLLIYKLESTRVIFERMGSHSDLFEA